MYPSRSLVFCVAVGLSAAAFAGFLLFGGGGPNSSSDGRSPTSASDGGGLAQADQPASSALTRAAEAVQVDRSGVLGAVGTGAGFFVRNDGQWADWIRFQTQGRGIVTAFQDSAFRVGLHGEEEDASGVVGFVFEDARESVTVVGTAELPGKHNYFIGNDPDRWRSHVPLFEGLKYEALYPGISVEFHKRRSPLEYDLVLDPGARLEDVVVRCEGVDGLSTTEDGALLVQAGAHWIRQPKPRTWEVDASGERQEVECEFRVLGEDRYGFAAPDWKGVLALVVDPGLEWSTYLGDIDDEQVFDLVATGEKVTAVGFTRSLNFDKKSPGFDLSLDGITDGFVAHMNTSLSGSAQLLWCTFLGGANDVGLYPEEARGIALYGSYVAVVGRTSNPLFPLAGNFFQGTKAGALEYDAFVSVLTNDGSTLVYSSYYGGDGIDSAYAVDCDALGRVCVTGETFSSNLPVTSGGISTGYVSQNEVMVARIDPFIAGPASSLLYSTYVSGTGLDAGYAITAGGDYITVSGMTSTREPFFDGVVPGDFDDTWNGQWDGFILRIVFPGTGQSTIGFSTYLGSSEHDVVADHVELSNGMIAVTGYSYVNPGSSTQFPTTANPYQSTGAGGSDVFVTVLDPSQPAASQLAYSSLFGGDGNDVATAIDMQALVALVVTGNTRYNSTPWPVTANAFDPVFDGPSEIFVARIRTDFSGSSQLNYSTFLGGSGDEDAVALDVVEMDATVGGWAWNGSFPLVNPYETYNGGPNLGDCILARLGLPPLTAAP